MQSTDSFQDISEEELDLQNRLREPINEIIYAASYVLGRNDIRNPISFLRWRQLWRDVRSFFTKEQNDPLFWYGVSSSHWDDMGTNGFSFRREGGNGASVTFYFYPDSDEVRVTFSRGRYANDVDDLIQMLKERLVEEGLMKDFQFVDVLLSDGTTAVEGRLKLPFTMTARAKDGA